MALLKGAATAAGSYATQKALSRMELLKVKPLRESIGITFALSIQLSDVAEEEVSTAYANALNTFQQYKGHGYQPDRFLVDVNGNAVEIELSTYGSLDELNEDELGELYEGIEDHDPMSLLEPNSIEEETEPTVSSMSVFFIPRSINTIDDLPKLNEYVVKLNQELTTRLSNKGSMKYLYLTMTKEKSPELGKLVKKLSIEQGIKEYEYSNQNAQFGYQILNPSEAQLTQIVKGLKSEFGGTFRKLGKIRR